MNAKLSGIKAKTALAITLGGMVIVALLTSVQVAQLRTEMRDDIGRRQLALLEPIAEDLDRRLGDHLAAVTRAAREVSRIDAGDDDILKRYLDSDRELFRRFDAFMIAGLDGRVRAAVSDQGLVGRDVSTRAYFRTAIETRRPLITEPFIGRPLGEPVVAFVAPVLDADGKPVGIVFGSLHLLKPNFLGNLANVRVGREGRFRLLSLDRKVIISSEPGRMLSPGPAPGRSENFDRVMNERAGWVEGVGTQTGERSLFSFKRLEQAPWVLAVGVPSEEAYAPVNAMERRTLVFALVLCMTLPVFGWLGARRLLKPLSALRDGVNRLRALPDSDALLDTGRRDEIGAVATAFNELLIERRATGTALAASEQRMRAITDHLPALIAYVDVDECFCFANQTYEFWYGRHPDEYIGRPVCEMVGVEEYAVAAPYLKRALSGEPVRYQRESRTGDRSRLLEVRYNPDVDMSGRVVGVFVMLSDITALAEAERVATESRAAIEGLIASARDAIITADEEQRVVIFNRAAEQMFGWKAADIIGQPIDRMIPARFRAAHRRQVERFGEGAQEPNPSMADRVVTGVRADGSEFPIEASVSRVHRAGGFEYTVIMRDVTERMRAARELRANAVMLRQTVEHMPLGVSVMDAKLNVIAYNERFLELMGFPADGFAPGDPLEKFFRFNAARGEYGPGDVEEQVASRVQLARRAEPHCFERMRGDGVVVEVRGTPVPGGGFVTVYTDVTARREESRRLTEARENAEATARAKSEFLATMSHEVRTPMNGVLGIAELLLDTEMTADQRDYVETILRSGQALLEILNDILDLSKIEAGKLELESIAFDPVQAMTDVVALSAPRASAKGLVLSSAVAPDVPRDVIGDPGRLRQVLSNLLGNSLKFTDTGQVEVGVSIERIEGDDVVLAYSVKDTGIGMTSEQQAKLFRAFTQADASTTRRFGGTGLGLAICLKLVEMMDGAFRVESEPGQGSTFVFTMRCRRATPGAARAEIAQAGEARRFNGRVLVVEDNVVNRKVARATLKAFGLTVLEAENGSLALDVLARESVDLVFMDMHMPVMDGIEATLRIRTLEKEGTLGGRRPIVAMTANVLREAIDTCMEAGMDDFLPKPFARRQMIDVLARWLEREGAPAAPAPEAEDPVEAREAPSAPALDLDTFRTLAETMGDEIGVLLDDFTASTGSMFASLAAGPDREDAKIVTRLAHTLKSSAAMVGAMDLSARAKALESAAKGGDIAGLDTALDGMRAEFERVRTALDAAMGRQPVSENSGATADA
jgi:PAS domain S-box-containing protein